MLPNLPTPIAIVGMAMRLPGSIDNEAKLWDLLVNKRDAVSPIPKGRYKGHGKSGIWSTGYFLGDLDLAQMDSGFFSMSKAEAEQLDPHHRPLLEVVYEAFESAGETKWKGKDIGCYVGFAAEDWNDLQSKDPQEFRMYRLGGSFDFALANRISYEYDLRGPSFVVKAACASSMLGLHLACEAVSEGRCSSAIVAGANLILTPAMTMVMYEAGALSGDNSCKTFDARANGYARADAINAVYIKRLDDAIRDGNPIRAIIRATTSNCNGKTPGIGNPSIQVQDELIRNTYKQAGLDVVETAFCECHGTGTAIGDVAEALALANIWGESGILMGSVKPNLGHAEAASGLTSVIKAVLCLENKTILPNIKFESPNPKIPWESARLVVPTEPTSWPKGRKERISVNNFGFGGLNCHVIMDSAASFLPSYLQQARPPGINTHPAATNGVHGDQNGNPSLLVFSANHEESLASVVRNIEEFYNQENPSLNDLAYTLGARREHLPYRAFAITDGSAPFETTTAKGKTIGNSAPPIFVFTGQGAQWPGMGKELMMGYPSFLRDIREMDSALAKLKQPPAFDIESEIQKPASTSLLEKAEYSQPISTAFQIALVNLLRSWGVRPSAVIGHSSGDIAAAYAAGAYTMEEAITISYYRGVAMKAQKRRGGMAAIGLGTGDVAPLLPPTVSVACVNSGNNVTISGDELPLDCFMGDFKKTRPDVFARRVRVEMAYHSSHMQDVAGLYQSLLEGCITPQAPTIPYFSTVKEKFITEAKQLGPSYWVANLVSPVLFHSGIKAILDHDQLKGNPHVEIGPHSALAGPLKQIYKEMNTSPQYLSLLSRNADPCKSMLKAMGHLFSTGVDIDFAAMNPKGITLPSLPKYAWHREGSYWHESRVMKAWRFKEFPHHDILGSRVTEASDLEPVWRNLLRPDTVPGWVLDCVIRTKTMLPAAAYVAMAGQAIYQLSGGRDYNYTVRNTTISASPLVIQPGESLELITSLRPHRLTATENSEWYDFSIVSGGSAGWVRHCHGQVRSGCVSRYTVGDAPLLSRSVPSGKWYKAWRRLGLEYGPSFRGLRDISVGTNKNVASATVLEGLTDSEAPYQLHPTSMTMIFHAIDTATYHGQTRALNEVSQPTYIEELYVGLGTGKEIRIHLGAKISPGNAVTGSGYGVDNDGVLAIHLKGVTLSPLIGWSTERGSDTHAAVQLKWIPDIDIVDPGTLIRPEVPMESAIAMIEKLFVLCAIENALQLERHSATERHLRKYQDWLQEHVEFAKANKSRLVSGTAELCALSSAERQARIHELMVQAEDTPSWAACRIIHRVYESVVDIIDGKVDALELLFRDDTITEFYNFFDWVSYRDFAEQLGHGNPNLRVLEVGAGTGSMTENIIKYLKDLSGKRLYSKYFYTDISAGFFIKASERFMEYSGIEYRTFDVTKNPAEQDLEEGSFDLVIAANVLHATPRLAETLSNVRKLLRPRGRFLLCELCPETKFNTYIMGLLPGWWLGEEDWRAKLPYLFPEQWDRELRNAGFDGVESVCYDQKSPYQQNATMTARATDVTFREPSRRITLLAPDGISSYASAIGKYLQSKGLEVDRCSLGQTPPPNQDMISVYELETPFIHNIAEKEFRDLVDFVCSLGERRILWLTHPAQMGASDPRYSLVVGLARTIRSELGVSFGVLELDCQDHRAWEATLKVFEKLRTSGVQAEETEPDYEFALCNGVVHVSRFTGVSVMDELAKIGVQGSPKRLQIGKKGVLETLRWVTWLQESPLGPSEVEVDVRASGMNYRDVDVFMGIVEGEDFGYECAGLVHKIGPEVQDFKVGDHVMVFSEGSLCSRLRVSSQRCIKMPSGLTFEEAATMPSIYATVIRGLLDVGHVTRGRTVLVQDAARPAGIAALYICRSAGAEVYATTDSPEEATFLTETFGLTKDRTFSSMDESFLVDVLKATDGKGVDLVMNSLTGELLHASLQCVAENGIMVELGKRDIVGHGKLALDLFNGNRGFFGIDIARLCAGRPFEARKLLETIVAMYEVGEIRPFQSIVIFDAENISEAFQFMEKREHNGRVAIRMPEDPDSLPGVSVPGLRNLFRPDVSYLLVGGLGNLGQAIATWMVERGARNLVFFSRSAAHKDVHGAFFDDLVSSGCSVQTFSGDAGKLEDVKQVVINAEKPIAGVMQMSVAYRDRSFAEMTMREWNDVMAPRVHGTWHLHEALGDNLDFFVMFSSAVGLVGQWGQANYAATNTFLDAFAQFRQNLGLTASVIDIGVLEDVGSLTSNQSALEALRASAYWMLMERDLLDALELMILRSSKHNSPQQEIRKMNSAYTSSNQLGLGIKSTLPLSDPKNRVIWRRDRRMAAYRNDDDDAIATATPDSNNCLPQFLASVSNNPAILDSQDSIDILAHEIGRYLNSILRTTDGELDLRAGFIELGLDSLIMIELRNWLRQSLGTDISVSDMVESGSIMQVGGLTAQRLRAKYDAAIEGK